MMKFTLTNESATEDLVLNTDDTSTDLLINEENSSSPEHGHPLIQQQQQIITVVPIEKDAPGPENWYHGRLDRLGSEERLRQANKPASFLVRESERKHGSFVLSYYSLKSNIYHFKITAVFGDYYIGGRRFDRLETLISYYMYYSELVKGEKLENPIAPTRICKLERTYLSIKPYSSNNCYQFNSRNLQIKLLNESLTSQLSSTRMTNQHQFNWTSAEDILYFERIGERFRVFHEVGDGEWLWAQSYKSSEFGLLNADCVIQIDDFKLHEIEPWYYSNISKEEAASILADAGNYSYLVRPSDQQQGNFTLFFYVNNIVHRYRITSSQDNNNNDYEEEEEEEHNSKEFYTKYYTIGGRDFTSITSIVDRYMNEDIAEGYRLTLVPHKRPEYYSQSITAFLKAYLNYKKIDYVVEHSERALEKSCSFKVKSASLRTHESYSFNNRRNSIVQNQNLTVSKSNLNNSTNTTSATTTTNNNNNYLNIPDLNSKNNKLSQTHQNESTINSTLASNSSSKMLTSTTASYKQSVRNESTKSTTTPKTTLPTSKSISSPLSSITLHNQQHANATTLVNSTSFKDLRNYDLISQFDPSSVSKKMFCGNFSRTSITIKPLNGAEFTSTRKQQDKNVLTGYLNKYNEKTKKWKPYWFLLRQTEQQLFYFSNEKRLKEKGLIDLSYGFYYPVDESFFNKPFCFQIIIQTLGGSTSSSTNQSAHSSVNNNIAHYLSADNLQMFKEWTENIRPLCNPIQFNPFVCAPFGTSSMSCLSLSSSLSSTSTTSSGSASTSTSSSLSSSSPLNTSESDQNNLKRIKSFLNHHNHQKQHQQNSSHQNIDKNYRILRTLNVDIHEARNVCFSPQNKSNQTINENQLHHSNHNHSHSLPKYHKDNLYYCLILFNNDAYVASTRHTTCNNLNSNSNQLTSSFSAHSSSSNGFDMLNSSSHSTNATNKHSSKDSIWDDSFSFDNLPLDVKELKICLFVIAKPTNFSASFVNNLKKISSSNSSSKMLDPLLIGSVNIRLDDLINKGLHEAWYTVEPEVHVNTYYESNSSKLNNNCTLRVKIRFCEEKIHLNRDHYKELCAYLTDEREHKHLCTIYEQIIPSTERSHLVHSLVRFFIVKNQIAEMLKSFLLTEIERCADLSTLFRPATMSTSLMDHYMRTRCDEFLRRALEEPLVRILKQSQTSSSSTNVAHNHNSHSPTTSAQNQTSFSNIKSFELDPTKCKDASQREKNLVNLQWALKELISSICNPASVALFPNELKHLFYLVRQHVHFKWKQQQCANNDNTTDDKLVRIYCVSAFVFLRLLCPALLNPKNFGLKFFDSLTNPQANLTNQTGEKVCTNVLNYPELANQFGVFSPAFMFSLSPPAANLKQTNELISSPTGTPATKSSSQLSVQIASVYERHLKLLAKVLQTLANMTECKEPFMVPLSDFLNVNKPNVIKFIEDISSLTELNSTHVIKINENSSNDTTTANESELNNQFENASCKYLAILYRLLNSYVPQMKQYLEKSTSTTSTSNLNDSIHNIDDCLDDDQQQQQQQQDGTIKQDDSSFLTSIQKLINILNDISKKAK